MSDRESAILEQTRADAERNGFFVCPDAALLDDLVAGLATNQERYGYPCCPCRIASGVKSYDADIVCPCEYRDADCHEFGMCFCGLYVSQKVRESPSLLRPIPERRPIEITERAIDQERNEKDALTEKPAQTRSAKLSKEIPVWRCTVCGYLAAREHPPSVCPICKAKAERFERFNLG